MTFRILDTEDAHKLPDLELTELVREALESPEMKDEFFDNIVESLGEQDWVGSAFAPSLKHFVDYIESRDEDKHERLLSSLGWAVHVFCEVPKSHVLCKEEFKTEFADSLKRAKRLFADCYCSTGATWCLIGMVAASGESYIAKMIWDYESGFFDELIKKGE